MKRYFWLLLMLAAALHADAQLLGEINLDLKDLKDLISKTAKGDTVHAVDGLLEHTVTPDLYLIRQQYRLERKGKTYGKNHKPYYGETYSLGIKVSGGMYVSNAVIAPWDGDADYERVNADGKYKPEYFWTYQRHLNDSVYKSVELDLGTSYMSAADAEGSLWFHQDLQSDFGLSIDNATGEKDGYMLWAYSTTDVQDSAMVVELRRDACKMAAKADSTLVPIAPKEEGKLIGGVFVVPKYKRGGVVKIVLAGIAVKGKQGRWGLHLFTDKEHGKATAKDPAQPTAKQAKSDKKKTKTKAKGEELSGLTPTK